MSPLNKFYYVSGLMLTVGGAIVGLIGFGWLRSSLAKLLNEAELSMWRFFIDLILPYTLVLSGVASICFGLIMLIRGYTLRDRLSSIQ